MKKLGHSLPQAVLAARPFTSVATILLTLGLAGACGDDDSGGNPAQPDSGPVVTDDTSTGGTATDTTVDTTTDTATDTTADTTGTGPIDTTDPTSGTSGDSTDTVDTTAATETSDDSTDTGEAPTGEFDSGAGSDCGGAGQACCAVAACNPGLLCVDGEVGDLDAGVDQDPDDTSVGDADIMPIDAAFLNQELGDAAIDGAAAPLVPGPLDAGVAEGGTSVSSDADVPPAPTGICEPCGGQGEQCCADDACGEGLACDTNGFGPNATSSCEPVPAPVADAGEEPSCGALGAQCCPGSGGNCDEGLDCDNGPMPGVADSECVVAAAQSDSGAGEEDDCGGLDQQCCPGGGGNCDDGLECDNPPGSGLNNSVCED